MPALRKLFVAGLGTLALSCSGMKLPSVSDTSSELLRSVSKGVPAAAECDKLDTDVSYEEEYALGGAVAINWVQMGGGLLSAKEEGNKKLLRYLNTVGKNLGAQSPRPTLKWTFGVLPNGEKIDAVSAPGGYVFVTQKLLQEVENEAQLAGVLAHEIAHITSKHALTRYRQVKVSQCKTNAFLAGTLDLEKDVGLLGSLTEKCVDGIVKNGFSKDDEFAADEQAVHLLISAGYDPQEYIRFLSKIPDSRSGWDNHPRKTDRVKKLVALLRNEPGSAEDFSDLPASTEGLVKPPLPPELSAAKSAVTRDQP